jgi:CheY-like chemotaxis protein
MTKKKILVVEDEAEMRAMLAIELETSNYQVFQAADGEVALRLAEEVRPDLIISDVMMPKMDGNQFLKRLRATDFGSSIPFVVLTARGKMRDYFETVEVDGFVSKPFEPEELLQTVEKALGKGAASGSGVAGKGKASAKKKVFIVDNDPAALDELQKIFEDYGYEIETAILPSKCLDEMVTFKPDAILSKYQMDELTADKLVELIRNMPHFKNIPIVIYAGASQGDQQEKVLKAGAAKFLVGIKGIKLLKELNGILKI